MKPILILITLLVTSLSLRAQEITHMDSENIESRFKEYFKNDEIVINGGIKTIEDIKNHLSKVDGVMIGRAVYHSPYFLADIERDIFGNN